jgi:hypothetical protein
VKIVRNNIKKTPTNNFNKLNDANNQKTGSNYLEGMIEYLPVHLPHRICVFPSPDRRGINRQIHLTSHIKHHHSTIVTSHRQQGLVVLMEVKTGHSRLSAENIFWM